MSNYMNAHVCSPNRVDVTRNGRLADIGFPGDEDPYRAGWTRVSITFTPDERGRLLRLREACDEALALLDEIEAEEALAEVAAVTPATYNGRG